MYDIPSNSDKAKGEAQVPAVTKKTTAKIVKKNFIKDAVDTFVDAATGADRVDLKKDIIAPTIGGMVVDIVASIANGIVTAFEAAIFKDSPRNVRRRKARYSNGYGYDYNAPYRGKSNVTIINGSEEYSVYQPRMLSSRAREQHVFDEIKFSGPTAYDDAAEILEYLQGEINQYHVVTLAKFYGAVKEKTDLVIPTSPQDQKWGWHDLGSACPRRISGGVIIDIPKPVYLD